MSKKVKSKSPKPAPAFEDNELICPEHIRTTEGEYFRDRVIYKRIIWKADLAGDKCFLGFLITEKTIDRPVAFVPFENGGTDEQENDAYTIALDIASGRVDPGDCWQCIGLECYGRPDSNMEMPAFVYRFGLWEMTRDGKNGSDYPLYSRPYCRFRAKDLAATSVPAATVNLDEKGHPIHVGSVIYDAGLGGMYGRVIHVLGDGLIFQPYAFSGPNEEPDPKPTATNCHQVNVVDAIATHAA